MCVCVFEADWETELHECGFDCQEVNVVARETRLSAVSQIPLCVCVCVCVCVCNKQRVKYHNETGNHCEDKKFPLSLSSYTKHSQITR